MFDASEDTANLVYAISNFLVLVGAIGAIGLFWAGAVRDKFAALKEADNAAKIAAANEGAAKANEGLAKATLDIEERRQENLNLSLQLENEKRGRAEHDALLRRRNFNPFDERQALLHPHKVTNIVLENVRGEEAEATAREIANLVTYCQWDVVSWHFTDESVASGIFVTANSKPLNGRDTSGEAQAAMVKYLESKGLKTGALPAWESKPLPENTVKITVGPSEIFEDQQPVRFRYEGKEYKVVEDGPQEPPEKPAAP